MEIDYIALATPAFFALIALESHLARRWRRRVYRLNDSIGDLATGMLQQIAGLLGAGYLVGGYLWIHGAARLFDLPAGNAATWIGCFLAVDFLYYWFHRWSHEVNFLWAAHVVHHQSEEYNLTVALRQSALQQFFSAPFYWPLALVGVPPAVFFACASFNTLYQFWIHTRLIGRLGPLESVLMTPSHHRVHHARNPRYLDRNHGATFIVWDRLFGTYEAEDEEVVYGVTTPLRSWNPLWANLHYWVDLFRSSWRATTWSDRIAVFLNPPGWHPAEQGGFQTPPPADPSAPKFDPGYPAATRRHVLLHFAALVPLFLVLQVGGAEIGIGWLLLGTAAVVWSLIDLGALLEARPWAAAAERVRLVLLPALTLPLLGAPFSWFVPVAFGGAALASHRPARRSAALASVSLLLLSGCGPSDPNAPAFRQPTPAELALSADAQALYDPVTLGEVLAASAPPEDEQALESFETAREQFIERHDGRWIGWSGRVMHQRLISAGNPDSEIGVRVSDPQRSGGLIPHQATVVFRVPEAHPLHELGIGDPIRFSGRLQFDGMTREPWVFEARLLEP